MFQIIPFIQSYGYIVIFVGSISEGESIVLLGGFASHEKYLFFPFVFFFAMLGAIAGDWFFFFAGKYKKNFIFKRFPSLSHIVKKPLAVIEKRPKFISFAMRFMYGFRYIVPMGIGASNVPTRQFLFWNGLGALFWAFTVTTAGYIAGDVLESFFGEIKKYEFRIIVFTVVVISATMIILRITQMILRQKKDE